MFSSKKILFSNKLNSTAATTTATPTTTAPLAPPNNPIITSVEALTHPEADEGGTQVLNLVKIKWDLQGTNEQITSYDIQQSTDIGSNWTTIDSYTSSTGQQYDLFDIDFENKIAYIYTIYEGADYLTHQYKAGPIPGVAYWFRIRANNQAGPSLYSPRSQTITPKSFVPPPVISNVFPQENGIIISWGEAPGVTWPQNTLNYPYFKCYWRDVSDPQLPGLWQESSTTLEFFTITGVFTDLNNTQWDPTVPGKTYEFQVVVYVAFDEHSPRIDPILVSN